MTTNERVLCLGLDGCSWDVLRPWMAAGHLPTLAKLAAEGATGDLISTCPPNTAPAWSSFMTGKNPGKHGIYDLTMLEKGTLKEYPASSLCLKGKALWEILSEHGKSVMVMSIPVTYPVRPVNGILISDFLTPKGSRDFIHPPGLLDELEQKYGPYRLHYNQVYTRRNIGNVLQEAFDVLEYQTQIACDLVARQPWDFMAVHFFGTDRLQHELWHLIDSSHPEAQEAGNSSEYQPRMIEYFHCLDQSLARIIAAAGENIHIVTMSDHGFGPTVHYVTINNWLMAEGYLRLKHTLLTQFKYLLFRLGLTPDLMYKVAMWLGLANVRQSGGIGTRHHIFRLLYQFFLSLQDVDWSRTRAYSKGNFGQIFLNVRQRESAGIVEMGTAYAALRRELVTKLRQLKRPGSTEPLLAPIYTREEIYAGDEIETAPDIFFLPADMSYKALGTMDFISNRFIQKSFGHSGDHRMEGLLLLSGRHFRPGLQLDPGHIVDLAPTILYLLDVPIPDDMDGHIICQAFKPEFLSQIRPKSGHSSPYHNDAAVDMSERDLSQIKSNLKALGYLG